MVVPGYMRSAEAAQYLGISTHTLRDWRSRRLVTFYKPGKDCLYRKCDLDAALQAFAVPARAQVDLAEFERRVANA